jgi:hypothetical protein
MIAEYVLASIDINGNINRWISLIWIGLGVNEVVREQAQAQLELTQFELGSFIKRTELE